MNRAEASAVLHEVLAVCNGSLAITSVSLNYSYSSLICQTYVGYQIKMKCDLDDGNRKCIQPILDKHNLKIDEMKGTVVIY